MPSEVKGLRAAWQKFGKLQWSELIQPSIDIAEEGFKVSKHLADHAKARKKKIKDETLLYVSTLTPAKFNGNSGLRLNGVLQTFSKGTDTLLGGGCCGVVV